MKQAQNARKQRARSSSRKGGSNKGGNPGNSRSEMKVRGNPKQLLEKYKNQAREAKQAGDHVTAEYYYQFADHYQRVCNELRGPNEPAWSDDDDMGEDLVNGVEVNGNVDDGSDDQSMAADDEQPSRNNNRRGRGNRRGQNRNGGGDDQPRMSPENQEQPIEVHPELDLQGTLAPEGEDKPRRRGPARRRTPRGRGGEGAGAEAGAEATEAQGGEAA